MKRVLSFLLSIVLIAGIFTGCSGKSNNTATSGAETKTAVQETTKAVKKDPIELTFFYPVQVGGPLTKYIDKFAEDFMAANPDIKIKAVYTGSYDDTSVKTQTAIQGKNPPDMAVLVATEIFTLVNMDAIIPLDDLIAKDGGSQYINDFLPAFMDDTMYGGKIWSIPFQRSTPVLFYNKDAFKAVGLDPEQPPKNWDELAKYAQKLTVKDNSGNVTQWGVEIPNNAGSAQWLFGGFCLQNSKNGENMMTDDGKKVMFNTPENVEALTFWVDLAQKYKAMPEGIVNWSTTPSDFIAGKTAMMYHTTGNLVNVKTNAKFDFGVSFLPGNKRYGASTGGGNIYIFKDISPERQEAAYKFIRFLTEPERAAQWSVDTGYVAPRKSSHETEIMKKYYESLPQASVAKDQLQYAKREVATFEKNNVWTVFNNAVQAAVTKTMTAAEALQKAQEEAEKILAPYNAK